MIDPSIILNKLNPKVRLNSICPYFTMFPLTFPFSTLSRAKKKDLIYDPFCGRGTTNYAARLLGIGSYGVDSNPVAQAIAQAKMIRVDAQDIINLCEEILEDFIAPNNPQGEFWDWAYDLQTLNEICKLRQYFLSQTFLNKAGIGLRAIVLGILHGPILKTKVSYLSNQMPRTFATKPDYSVRFWKQWGLKPRYISVLNLVREKSEYFFNSELPQKTPGRILLGDSRSISEISDGKFDWVVTSPPYFGMSTYEQDQWLRNWFLGGNDTVNYSSQSQLKHHSESVFISDLGKVWENSATKSKPGARLIIRFGALPSKAENTPSNLIRESLAIANCGWKINRIRTAGKPPDSVRQANQFKNKTGKYIEEIDVSATLNI